jgi:two-component system CheB/CheR fusion protein
VEPLVQPNADGDLLLVVFEEKAVLPTPTRTEKRKKGNDGDRQRREDLEKELQYSHEVHQATVEAMESANEELKSTNEELQSTNEELQSTNEELESSKEEQQSLNEELVTVNAELQAKIDELTLVHDDMRNLLNATEIATIFLNQKLSVRRFTPKATAIVNLIEADIGRPLEHVVHNLEYETLIKDAENVLQTLATREAEVRSRDGNWYQMRIMPYRTTDNVIDGVVLTFSDITAQKRIQEKLIVSEERFRVALTASRTMVFNQDRDLRYTWAPSGSSLWSDKGPHRPDRRRSVPSRRGRRAEENQGRGHRHRGR